MGAAMTLLWVVVMLIAMTASHDWRGFSTRALILIHGVSLSLSCFGVPLLNRRHRNVKATTGMTVGIVVGLLIPVVMLAFLLRNGLNARVTY
jgi:putative effector of murein hydrolase